MHAPKTEVALIVDQGEELFVTPPEYVWMLVPTDRRIGTPYEFRVAAEGLVEIRRALRAIAARHETEIKAAHVAHKLANEAKHDEEGDLPASEAALAAQVAHYLRAWAVDDDRLVPVNDQVPMIEGLGWSIRYKPVVKDVKKLLSAVMRGKVPIDAITVNDAWLRERVTRLREAFNVPGCGYEIVVVPAVTEEKP